MGHASYDYVAPCSQNDRNIDSGLPFVITGEHIPLSDGSVSAIKYVFITLYNLNGTKEYIIKMGPNLFAQFEYPVDLLGTDIIRKHTYYINNNSNSEQSWTFTVSEGGNDIQLRAKFYESTTGHAPEIKVKYRWASMQIWISKCFVGQSCGLCGMWDIDPNNDLHVYNSSNDNYYYLNPNWDNYHVFGDSWCNSEISLLHTSGGDQYCTDDTNLTVVMFSLLCFYVFSISLHKSVYFLFFLFFYYFRYPNQTKTV